MKWMILGGAALTLAVTAYAAMQDTNGSSRESMLAKAEAAGIKPLPGKYSSKMELISINIPDAPPEVANMMRGILSRTIEYCLTEEDLREGYKTALAKSQEGDCSYERFDISPSGSMEGEMVCTADGRKMRMEMQGTGTPTSSDVTMNMSGDMGMGPGSMKMRVVQNRLGDC